MIGIFIVCAEADGEETGAYAGIIGSGVAWGRECHLAEFDQREGGCGGENVQE